MLGVANDDFYGAENILSRRTAILNIVKGGQQPVVVGGCTYCHLLARHAGLIGHCSTCQACAPLTGHCSSAMHVRLGNTRTLNAALTCACAL
jgi:hypothetical protein